jgi:hypothetical protein
VGGRRIRASGEQRTDRTNGVVDRRLHAGIICAVQPNVVMLQRVKLRTVLHHHEKQREQYGDDGSEATCHRNVSCGLMTDRW